MALGKKGDIFTLIYLIFMMFALGIAAFIGHMILNEVIPEIEKVYTDNEWGATNISEDSEVFQKATEATDLMDNIYLILFMGVLIAMVVSAFMTPTHPVMIGIFILVITILIIVSAMLSNVWMEIAANDAFSTTITSFPITDHFMDYMPWYTGAFGVITMVILYMRRKNEQVL